MKKLTLVDMVEKFQCPGCMHGPSPKECDAYTLDDEFVVRFEQPALENMRRSLSKLQRGASQ